ncbi:MAG TPA: histidine phosphatase family protein [Acidimicrobiales bacterium]|nr:histidine phosphatase family protein [Acidimicrobiales bacterium]
MGRFVWVLRHAKAARDGPDDHSRPLTARGRRQATEVGRAIADGPGSVVPPALVLCSSARRAVQSAQLVSAELDAGVELVVDGRLYRADPDDVIGVLRELGAEPSAVMVVGHNPTVHELALLLLEDDDTEGRARLERGFPTAAVAVVEVSASSWDRLSPGTGTLRELRTPVS